MPDSIPEISAADGRAAVTAGAFLLDVREADEWAAGHAPDAVWIAMGEITERVAELPNDRQVLVICRSGARSAKVTEFLRAQGVDAVNFGGGMRAWAAEGYDVVAGSGGAGTVI